MQKKKKLFPWRFGRGKVFEVETKKLLIELKCRFCGERGNNFITTLTLIDTTHGVSAFLGFPYWELNWIVAKSYAECWSELLGNRLKQSETDKQSHYWRFNLIHFVAPQLVEGLGLWLSQG
jgi:hypothetical protein